tara:strand:- start:219 stop:788 length:570 start_codon:yes stop_codon:yes gene_type:complete
MILAIFLICLVSLTPLPTLPMVIYYYSKFGLVDGFIVVTIASNLKIFIHYNIGNFLRNKKIKFLNLDKKLSKAKKKYKHLRSKDILLIRLSNLFITRILNIFLGFSNFSLKKTFIINNVALIPWQLLYFYSATKIDPLSEFISRFGIDITIVKLLSFISITSITFLIIRVSIAVLKRFKIINKIGDFLK